MNHICALITLFYPDYEKLEKNIRQILSYADRIYLLANSKVDFDLKNSSVVLIQNERNFGLSKSFNSGIRRAAEEGFEFAIFFDQDSFLSADNFERLFREMLRENKKNAACIGPSLKVRGNSINIPRWTRNGRFRTSGDVLSVNNVITSGMLVNISAFRKVGGFDENFPVDFSDFTFCWNCIRGNYAVLQSMDALMSHEIGNSGMSLGKHTVHFHAPYRNYFLVRDTLNIIFRYKSTPLKVRVRFLLLFPARLVLYFLKLDRKMERLRMCGYGLYDFVRGVHGFGKIADLLGAE